MGIDSTEGNGEERSGDGGPPEPSRGEMALEREEEEPGDEANGYGVEETTPAHDLTPWPRPSAVVPWWLAVVPRSHISGSTAPWSGSTAPAVVPCQMGGSTARDGARRTPTAVVRSGTTGDAKFKNKPTKHQYKESSCLLHPTPA